MAKQLNVNVAVTADTASAKAQLQELQNTLTQLSTNGANLKVGLDTSQLNKAITDVDKLSVALKNATNASGTLDFSKFNNAIRANGSTLQQYGQQLLQLGPKGQQAFTQLASAVAKSEVPMNRMKGILGEFGTVLGNTIKWQAASSAIHGMMGSIQHAFSYAEQLNKSLNNIQIVTQQSDAQMAKFAEQANNAAKSLSTTTTAYSNAALIYYQQGLSDKEVAARTETTIKMANASGQSAEKVSNQMTAIWNNFAEGSTNLEYYADVITALGAATASSSEEIATGLQKFASVADTVGLSYENATAALATITATTRQSADSVGTGLRTLFARLQSLNLGETLDDGVTLSKYSKALDTIGVKVLDYGGNLRSADEILEDMGTKWQELTDAQKAAVAQTVGGVRQYTTIMALMDNFDFYKQNQEIARNSEGTVQAQADIYAKSWEAAQKRVKAASESLYSDLINDDFFISLNNGFASVLNLLDQFIDKIGGLKGLLPAVSTMLLGMFSGQIINGLTKLGRGLVSIMPGAAARDRRDRDNFLSQAGQQMLGIRDPNKMTDNQKMQVNWAKQELDNQRLYAVNQGMMNQNQRTLAQMAMDKYSNNRQAYANAEQKLYQAQYNQAATRGTMIGNRFYDGSSYNDWDTATQQRFDMAQHNNTQVDTSKWLQNGIFNDKQYLQDLKDSGAIESLVSDITKEAKINGVLKSLANGEILDKDAFLKTINDKGLNIKQSMIDALFDANTGEVLKDMPSEVQAQLASGTQAISDKTRQFATEWGFDPKDVEKYAKAIEEAGDNEEELAKIREQMEQSGEEVGEALDQSDAGLEFANAIQKTVQATTGAVTSFQSFSNAAEIMNENIENGGDIFDNFSTVLPNLITGLTGVMSVASAIGGPLGIFIGLLTAAAGIVSQTDWGQEKIAQLKDALDTRSDSRKELDALKETSEEMGTALEEAKQKAEDFLNANNAHNRLLDEINNLTAGTAEFRQAVRQANQQVKEMIETYEGISWNDVERDENGALRLRDGVAEAYQEKLDLQADRIEAAKNYIDNYAIQAQGIVTAQDALGISVSPNPDDRIQYDKTNMARGTQFQLHDIGAKYQGPLKGYEGGVQWYDIADVIEEFNQQNEYAELEEYFKARGGKTANANWKEFKSHVLNPRDQGGLGLASLEDYAASLSENYTQRMADLLDTSTAEYFDNIGYQLMTDTEKDFGIAFCRHHGYCECECPK